MESTNHVVGVDEAGAGPAFGSLWAAAVCLDGAVVDGLRDSKKLSEKKRKALRETIVATCSFGLGEVTHAEIDALGMGECRRLVFERALDDYALRRGVEPSRIIVDGHLFRQWRTAVHECHDKADDKFPEVSAASVLAKTSRDAQVLAWCDEDPTLDERYVMVN